jgi:hypothetical protein
MHKQGQNYGLNYRLHACEYDTCMTTQPNKAGITALTITFMLVSTILV